MSIQVFCFRSRGGLWHRILSEAETIARDETPSFGTRTLDIVHLATAKIFGAVEFCTCDQRQVNLAARLGLKPIMP
jgi:hypothetical protein